MDTVGMVIIIIILGFIAFTLSLYAATLKSLLNTVDNIAKQTKPKEEPIVELPDEEEIIPAKKFIKNVAPKSSYMMKKRGYISQLKIFNKDNLSIWEIEKLPSEDIHTYIKKVLFTNFMFMLKENNLSIFDLRFKDTYAGYFAHNVYYIPFWVLDNKYDNDRLGSEGTVAVLLKDGTKKKLKMVSYFDNFEEYYDTKEYETVDFFDALKKSYKKFEVNDDIKYGELEFATDSNYVISINDLFNHFNMVFAEDNIMLVGDITDRFDWLGNIDTAFENPHIIDDIWSIYPKKDRKVHLCNKDDYEGKRNSLFKKYLNENDESLDSRFIAATIYYYDCWTLERVFDRDLGDDYDETEQEFKNKAITIWEDLAKQNHAYSLLILGILYNDGVHVLKDIDKSKEYLRKAYDNGLKELSIKVWNDFGYE